MNINDAFPSKYIKASDLQGRDVPVTIDRVEVEQVGRERDTKPVLYFRGKEKGLVLNKTNSSTISKQHGTDTDGWTGKSITIYAGETEFGGETVECVRVRLKPQFNGGTKPAAAPQPQYVPAESSNAPLTDDDIPF